MAPFDTCQYFGTFQRCVLLIFLLLPVVISLNCYQSQGSTNAPPGTPAACPATASASCTWSTDWNHQLVQRGCQGTNCTFQNGTANPAGGCYNSTTGQTYCCCATDNCNWAIPQRTLSTVLLALAATFGCLGAALIGWS